MSRLPYSLNDNWNDARPQIEELIRTLFEERIGGLEIGVGLESDNDSARAMSPIAFSVHKGGTDQSIPDSANTKVTWPAELFDTRDCFANNKFTAPHAGTYFFAVSLWFAPVVDQKRYIAKIYKNGTSLYQGPIFDASGTNSVGAMVYCVVHANAGDYFEAYCYHDEGGAGTLIGTSTVTHFSGFMIGHD